MAAEAGPPGPPQAQLSPEDLWPPGARRWVVLKLGFGTGQHFLALWQAWQQDPQACAQLVYVATAACPPSSVQLRQLHAGTPLAALAHALADAWPPLTRNVHLIALEGGRVRLLLAVGPPRHMLRQLRLKADAIDLDLTAPPGPHGDWHPRQIKTLARLAAADAHLRATGASAGLQAGLKAAGFVLEPARAGEAGLGAVARARYAPHFQRSRVPETQLLRAGAATAPSADARPPGGPGPDPAQEGSACKPTGSPGRQAVIIGAGIAGACCAHALARLGWQCTVLDAQDTPASGASGNPAALFHGTVHAADGHHARFTRAAALQAQQLYTGLTAQGVPGQVGGLLRAHADVLPQEPASALPADWVQRLEGDALRRLAPGLRASSAWFYPGGGWIDPGAAVRALLSTPGVRFRGGVHATALVAGAAGWQVLDATGAVCAAAAVVVLANASADPQQASTQALLRSAGAATGPMMAVRGQVTWFDSLQAPAWPLAGAGYAVSCGQGHLPSSVRAAWTVALDGSVVPNESNAPPRPPLTIALDVLSEPEGQKGHSTPDAPARHRVLCGATSQPADADLSLRAEDHRHNLERLVQLTGITAAAGTELHGRSGWRETAPDRLPMVGPAPLAQPAAGLRLDQARWVPRVPGLFVLGALAGRGCTWSPLAGEVLAALIDGSPVPLEADLLDAIDPARWLVRQARALASQTSSAAAASIDGPATG